MWNRTKRIINAYLEGLIEKVSGPDRGVREVTQAEVSRLRQVEVGALAAAKVMEKELAEAELKMMGVAERERLARERGDSSAASVATNELVQLSARIDLLRTQVAEAQSSAARANALREERRRMGEELAVESQLTRMREEVAGVHGGFDPLDSSSTIDEMRSRIRSTVVDSTAAKVAEADRQMEVDRARSKVDELLQRYKQTAGSAERVQPPSAVAPSAPDSVTAPPASGDDAAPESAKTLGRNEGPVRPID